MSCWRVLALVVVLALGDRPALACEPPEGVAESFTVLEGGVVVLSCEEAGVRAWADGSRLLLPECVDGNWTATSDRCVDEPDLAACDPAATPTPPSGAVVLWEGVEGVVYGCESGKSWASGRRAALVQCLQGHWTPLDDACLCKSAAGRSYWALSKADAHPQP
nr:uncharacterized protein LOC113824556 [Penaeus vannamei]